MKITIDICTRNRYNILYNVLLAILNQTHLHSIDEIIIYDDTPSQYRVDLRNYTIYNFIFHKFDQNKIRWSVKFGNGRGQVTGHQLIKEIAGNDWIWRLDDDHIPEKNVLGCLSKTIINDKTIVSCCIPHYFSIINHLKYNGINKIDNLNYNSQWIIDENKHIDECEHLYSSFLYNRKHTLNYPLELSPVGHREETIFTYRNFKHGCKLLVNREYVIWHAHFMTGGIRSNDIHNSDNFVSDEKTAKRIIENLKKWNGEKIIPVMGGIGDNYAFRSSFGNDITKLKRKYGDNVIIATSHKDVYTDMDIKIISIRDAQDILSEKNVSESNVYTFMARNDWKKSIKDAYKKIFEFE